MNSFALSEISVARLAERVAASMSHCQKRTLSEVHDISERVLMRRQDPCIAGHRLSWVSEGWRASPISEAGVFLVVLTGAGGLATRAALQTTASDAHDCRHRLRRLYAAELVKKPILYDCRYGPLRQE